MDSKAFVNTSYIGTVTLSTRTKGVVNRVCVHNSGTREFMDRLAQLVCGYATDVVPAYINIVKSNSKTAESVLLKPIQISGIVWGTSADPTLALNPSEKRSVVLCNAVITSLEINWSTISSDENLDMLLYTADKTTVLATISSPDIAKALSQVSANTDALVDWSLQFSSESSESEESV